MSITIQVVEEYKKSVDFEQDVIKTKANAYIIGFEDYKDKVAQAYLELDLSNILANRIELVI